MDNRIQKINAVVDRAMKDGMYDGERINLLMDVESADNVFHLRLDDWLNADKFKKSGREVSVIHCRDESPDGL